MVPETSTPHIADPLPAASRHPGGATPRALPIPILALAIWCGLLAGLLEVGGLVFRKRTLEINQFYGMSRHFVWLVPLTDVLIFLPIGLVLALIVRWKPRRGGWVAARLLCALTLLPPLLAAIPEVSLLGWLCFAWGAAIWLVPAIAGHPEGFRRTVTRTYPVLGAVFLVLVGSVLGRDWFNSWRETARALPPRGAPNVLLIVLDTVRADHLSLYGYPRRTSTTLDELARRGIRFDRAISTASWTLPSHASMFTGRWPHELSSGWATPLDDAAPTLAEDLSSRGYASAGFVANTAFCAFDSGLGRGFTTYRDFTLKGLGPLKMARLVDRGLSTLDMLDRMVQNWQGTQTVPPRENPLVKLFAFETRKHAHEVNREFLDWLARRRQPERPFFVFLNYFDTHFPYLVPDHGIQRFGARPSDPRSWELIKYWRTVDKPQLNPGEIAEARDGFDSCIADLDEQLGRLFDELQRRHVLDKTWVIITSDHGESFGEHGKFKHGSSLYQTEIHVPLLILPPQRGAPTTPRVVSQSVSLRDLAATILDLSGRDGAGPFPGASLARFWERAGAAPTAIPSDRALSEVAPTTLLDPHQWNDPILSDAIGSLVDGDWVYIHHEDGGLEELYNLRVDPEELRNRAAEPALGPRRARMRAELNRLTAGPLTRSRFNR